MFLFRRQSAEAGVIDPVCGMKVEPASAAAGRELEGTTYSFCSTGCAAAASQAVPLRRLRLPASA